MKQTRDELQLVWGNLPGKLRMVQSLFLKELLLFHMSRLLKHKSRMKGEKKKLNCLKYRKRAMSNFELKKINHLQ